MKINLDPLSDYLKKQTQKDVYLKLDDIERIIGHPLPPKAKNSPHWWYNNIHYPQSKTWLANKYKTINTFEMRCNEYIHFQRITSSIKYTFLYNRIFRLFFSSAITLIILPIIIGLVIQNITDNRNAKEQIQIIESQLSSDFSSNAETAVYNLTPYLEKHKDYSRLCKYYGLILDNHIRVFIENNYSENMEKINRITELGDVSLSYASKADSPYYFAFFNNLLGNIQFYLYKKTFNDSHAQKALGFYQSSQSVLYDDSIDNILRPLIDIDSEEGIKTALAVLEANQSSFEVHYSLIQNGVFLYSNLSETERTGLSSDAQMIDSIEKSIRIAHGDIMRSIFLVSEILEKAPFDINLLEHPAIQKSFSLSGRSYALMYLMYEKYGISIPEEEDELIRLFYMYEELACMIYQTDYEFYYYITGKNGYTEEDWEFYEQNEKHVDIFQFDQFITISSVNFFLERIETIAKRYHLYDELYATYFSLAQVNYVDFFYNNNQESYNRYRKYIDLFNTINDSSISLFDFDIYFSPIAGGEMLALYIEEVEQTLHDLSYKDNPCFFAYTAKELARHYLYEYVNVKSNGGNNDKLLEALQNAKKYYDLSLIYFTPQKDKQLYDSIQKDLSMLEQLASY